MTLKLFTTFLMIIGSIGQDAQDKTIILEKLQNQAICWNKGDIQCFMEDYWHSDKLLYVGKSGITYGWENVLNNYKKNYPTKREMGELKLDVVHLKKLGENHYLMIGRWQLTREIEDLSGHFTLIWQKKDGNWVIVTDHSS